LFGFLRSVNRRAKAKVTADQIAQAINAGSGGFFFCDDKVEFYRAVLEDELALSYLYGAIMFSIELTGEREEETIGYIDREVFERLFPGYGRSALEACNTRLKERNEAFKSGTKVGYVEMKGIWDSPGKGFLSSLHDRLSDLRARMS
jgi:hypothetical protein